MRIEHRGVQRIGLKGPLPIVLTILLTLVGRPPNATAQEPWLIKQIRASGNSDADGFTGFNGEVYFSAVGPGVGDELFKTDGTEAGTVLVKDIRAAGGSFPQEFTPVGDYLYFRATTGVNTTQLWRTDGTSEGTVQIFDVNPEPAFGSFPRQLIELGGMLYYDAFIGDFSMNRNEFWRTDGTEAGSIPVTDINGETLLRPAKPTKVGDRLILEAQIPPAASAQLWITDGTPAGTFPVESASFEGPVPIQSGSGSMPTIGDVVFFSAIDSFDDPDFELWRSDGTPEGTFPITDQIPEDISAIGEMAVVGDRLFFSAQDSFGDQELYVTDGTFAGTARVEDINASGDSEPEELTAAGGMLFFTAEDDLGDRELWVSDGAESGTHRVADIRSSGSSTPLFLAGVGNLVFFSAEDDTGERHLWRSDGTEEGTRRMRPTTPDGSSGPSSLVPIGGRLYFRANMLKPDGLSHTEPHALDVTTPHFENISTRGFVGTGDSVMIAGFIIEGGPKRVLVRALGPTLDGFGVPNTLNDPNLQIFSGVTQIASNDDWQDTQQTEIEATGLAPGFDVESAIMIELDSGAHTAIVSGGIGNAIVEVFELE